MSGGGGSAPSSTTQTTIPEWARPYAENALASSNKLLYDIGPNNEILGLKPPPKYEGYGSENMRVAGWTPMEHQAAANVMGQRTNMGGAESLVDEYGYARNAYNDLGNMAVNRSQYTPGQFDVNYNPDNIQLGSIRNATQADLNAYMNPYQQGVTDITKREALRDANIQNQTNQARAVQAGAFGGGRDAMIRAEAQRNLQQNLSDIQAKGSHEAYTSGLAQFNTEEQRRMDAWKAHEANRQFLQTAQQKAQEMGEGSRQFASNQGLKGIEQAMAAAKGYADVTDTEAGRRLAYGEQEHQQQLDLNRQLAEAGGIQRGADQARIDNAYADWVAAQNYPYKQLGFAADLVSGQPSGDVSVYEAAPSTASQIAGLGAAAYGASQLGKK